MEGDSLLARLAHFVARHRWPVIAVWVVLTLFGSFAAGRVSSAGTRAPDSRQVRVRGEPAHAESVRRRSPPAERRRFKTGGDATKSDGIRAAMQRAAKANPGALTSSVLPTNSLAYVSKDRHTTFMEIYPAGTAKFDTKSGAEATRAAAAAGLPTGVTVEVTGHDPLEEASTHGGSGGPSVLLEAVVGGLGALVILLFVFGTLPAVLMPIVVAVAAILNTFTLIWGLTYITNVSIIVQFLIALVGLGVAIDYALS
jgi:RND superfamily putative drug exporter